MTLHPQSQAFVDLIAAQPRPGWEEMSVEEARRVFDEFEPVLGDRPDVDRVEQHTLPEGFDVRVYSAVSSRAPAIVFFHGGGWVLGDLDSHDRVCRRLAIASECVVVAVEYRRSPEHRCPGPVEDAYRAVQYVAEQSDALNIDPDRIAVAGDSAGGHLAAAVCLRSREQGGPAIALQVLLYPVIEPDFETESYQSFATGFGLSRANMQWFWEQFLGGHPVTEVASPMRASSLRGLPPALVFSAEYDVLRDEGEAYARRMSDDGVDVTLERYDGMLHGFIHFAGFFDVGLEATRAVGREIKKRLRD